MGLEFDFSSVISKFENMEKKASKELTDKALKEGAEEVLQELKNETRATVYDTGELYNSLGIGPIKGSGTNKKILIGSQSDNRKIVERNYYNEYGTSSIVGKKHNKRAFKNSVKRAKDSIIESIRNSLK